MKNNIILKLICLSSLMSLTSCSVIGGIFKTGMGVGIFIVVAIIAIVLLVISKFNK